MTDIDSDTNIDEDTKIKVCGITNLEDALFAAGCGADMLGFIFYEKSSRYIKVEEAAKIIDALPGEVATVGVFVDESVEGIVEAVGAAALDAVQLHGDETPEFCDALLDALPEIVVIKAVRVRDEDDIDSLEDYDVSGFLLDTFREGVPGGTGETFDWSLVEDLDVSDSVILSGGLGPDNVVDAIEALHPYAVDVCSGVELEPGKKDHNKVKEFIDRVLKI